MFMKKHKVWFGFEENTDSFSRGEESPGASWDAQKISKDKERKDDYHVWQLWLSEKRQSLKHQGLKLQQSGGIPPFNHNLCYMLV